MPVIRDAVPADAERIGEAHAEAWRLAYEGLFPADELVAAVDIRRRMWVGLVGDPNLGGELLVVEEAGGVVGFIHFGPASENDEVGEVYGFYVHPSSWGTGDAQALMDRAVTSLAESFNRAILWTMLMPEEHEGSTPRQAGQKRATSVKKPRGTASPIELLNMSDGSRRWCRSGDLGQFSSERFRAVL